MVDLDGIEQPRNVWEEIELPRLFQLLVKPYLEDYHAAVVMASLPIPGTLATKVHTKYIDGNTL